MCVGKLPQIPIVTWKVNQVSQLKKKLIWVTLLQKERLFLSVEGSLFLVKDVMYSQSKREQQKSLINRQRYKGFDGFGPRVLPLEKGKIERETKREKKRFLLGRNARGRREQGFAAFKKIAKEERTKYCCLRKRQLVCV